MLVKFADVGQFIGNTDDIKGIQTIEVVEGQRPNPDKPEEIEQMVRPLLVLLLADGGGQLALTYRYSTERDADRKSLEEIKGWDEMKPLTESPLKITGQDKEIMDTSNPKKE